MTSAAASEESTAGAAPKGRRRGFFSLPGRGGLALTIYRTLLFTGLLLVGFELLAVDASLLGLAHSPFDMRGVAARFVPRYRTDLDMDQGFVAMGMFATIGCLLFSTPLPSLWPHHRWLRWLLYVLLLLVLGTPQF